MKDSCTNITAQSANPNWKIYHRLYRNINQWLYYILSAGCYAI